MSMRLTFQCGSGKKRLFKSEKEAYHTFAENFESAREKKMEKEANRICRKGVDAEVEGKKNMKTLITLKNKRCEETSLVMAPTSSGPLLCNFALDEPCKGTHILVEALEREDVTDLFAYRGGASMEIHLALTCSPSITNHLLRHEQTPSSTQSPLSPSPTRSLVETPIVEVTRSITKHNCQVLNVDDNPRIIKEAFFLATNGRPGPVLVNILKDI
ncbi:acetolactate synthase [Canna indica]|uniref:Acetolactate synthase n=1 Tax=Canna indica TaxID=4628 RepID=A0AAQ3KIH6_9LILI|nr:acetolactate synthase [Canna indica]